MFSIIEAPILSFGSGFMLLTGLPVLLFFYLFILYSLWPVKQPLFEDRV